MVEGQAVATGFGFSASSLRKLDLHPIVQYVPRSAGTLAVSEPPEEREGMVPTPLPRLPHSYCTVVKTNA